MGFVERVLERFMHRLRANKKISDELMEDILRMLQNALHEVIGEKFDEVT